MKRLLITAVAAISLFGMATVYGQSFSTVLDRMYENGLTKYSQVDNYRPNDSITRGEISKLFANYAEFMGLEKTKSASECEFNDINNYDPTLEPTIVEACEYGLVKGSNGSYFPNNAITEAEALTVTVRSILGIQDETKSPWWREYHEIGKWLSIIDNESVWDLDRPITRQKAGLWLYRASQVDEEEVNNEGTEELEEILKDIFGEDFLEE